MQDHSPALAWDCSPHKAHLGLKPLTPSSFTWLLIGSTGPHYMHLSIEMFTTWQLASLRASDSREEEEEAWENNTEGSSHVIL